MEIEWSQKVNDTGDDLPESVRSAMWKMAGKIVRQNKFDLGDLYEARKDIFQAGCLGYWLYKDAEYFPIKSIRHFMLNELANICWESSWCGERTKKRLQHVPIENINQVKLPVVGEEAQIDRVLNYERLMKAAEKSDAGGLKSGQRTKHMRTIRLFARHGITGKGERSGTLPSDINGDTYWYACKSLKNFALKVHELEN